MEENVSWLVISSVITTEFKLFQGVMSEYYSICCIVQAEFSVFFKEFLFVAKVAIIPRNI
jgi:hypothetical protein